MDGLATIANDLQNLHANQIDDVCDDPVTPKAKSKPKFVIVFWVDTKEFNVMPISKIRKENREEGKITKIKTEGKLWTVKLVQISGKCSIHVINLTFNSRVFWWYIRMLYLLVMKTDGHDAISSLRLVLKTRNGHLHGSDENSDPSKFAFFKKEIGLSYFTKWPNLRNETKWNLYFAKWKSVPCEMKPVLCEMKFCTLRNEICTLRNENLYFAKWKSVLCELKWVLCCTVHVQIM